MTDLRSDNTLGCSPEILEAIARAATDAASPYGNDPITARLRERCRELFETDLEIFPLITGTAGNAISIAATTPPWGAVFCHEDAHIYRDELGAPEFFGPGLKVVPVEGENGKLGPVEVERSIGEIGGTGRMAIPSCLSLTQATEAGTVYTPDELKAVCSVGRKAGLAIHMDGARFANAVAHLGCSAAETTWKAGLRPRLFLCPKPMDGRPGKALAGREVRGTCGRRPIHRHGPIDDSAARRPRPSLRPGSRSRHHHGAGCAGRVRGS